MSPQERWSYFIRYGSDKSKRRLINGIMAEEEGIAMAGQVVQGFTKHELELFHQISKDKWKTDMQSQLIDAQEEAREAGLAQGLEQGRREEREKAYREKLETARKALREGLPAELIGKITGLDPETIRGLGEAGV
jgi:predicted transposase/invertase (TIGR01784 family)